MKLSKNFKKIFIWLTGYLNIVAFVITGGYFFLKDEDEEIKATAKEVGYFTMGFFALDLINELVGSFVGLSGNISGGFNNYLLVVLIIKIIVFITLCLLDLFGVSIVKPSVGVRVHTDDVEIPSINESEYDDEISIEHVGEFMNNDEDLEEEDTEIILKNQ